MTIIKILTTIAFFAIASITMAQDVETDRREQFQFGLKAGLNYSNVYDELTNDFNADSKFGFVAGGVFRIPIGKYFGVQPEILFSQKGFKGDGVLLGNDYKFTRTTSYIDVPLQLAIKPADFLTIVAGPQFSYLVHQNDEFESTAVSISQEEEFDNDDIRENLFGFVAGLDFNLEHVILGTRLGWDLQYNHGDGSSSTPRYKNAWFQATIGYIIY